LDYEVHVDSPVRLSTRPSDKDLEAAAKTLLDALERFVLANPTQWFHFED
jgi:KDO2-lipid IV(A) lauroyltransferase